MTPTSKTSRTIVAFFLIVITSLTQAEESSVTTVLQFDVAEKSVEHIYTGQGPGSPTANVAEFSGNVSSAIYGFGISKGRYYASLSFEQPLRTDTSYKPATQGFMNISRYDRNLTLGYSLTQTMSVFCGYKYGRTEVSGLSEDRGATINGTPITGTYNSFALEFVETGPYVGANMDFYVNDDNSIGLNLAYASMDGEIKNTISDAGASGTGPASADGTADGLSLGLKWNHFVSDQTILNIGAKLNQYETTATDRNGFPTTFESDYVYFNIGLTYIM